MRILAMTGAPRMGVVNLIQGQSPYLEAWEAAIRPWLKAVQFDAHRCGLADRLSLLESFKGVDDRWAAVIHSALNSIQEDWANRAERSAEAIAQMIKDMLCAFEEAPLSDQRLKQEDELRERLMSKLPECEEMCRSRVEQLYHHGELVREEESVQALKFDLLDREGWQLLGLNKTQLASAGSVAGALTGGALDLSVGGASFFAGTVIGAMLGGVGAVWGGDSLGNVKVLGQPLGGKVLRVEVGASLEFAFVILDRALIHWAHVAKRAHARRDKLDLKANEMSVVSGLEKKQRNRFAKSFRHLWKQPDQSNWAPSFKALVLEIGPKEGLSKIQA
jgi:hypothetical protein